MLKSLFPLLLLWLAISAELAYSGLLPHGAVLFPLAAGILLWRSTAQNLLIAGGMLLLDWVARPTVWPLAEFIIPVLYLFTSWRQRRDELFQRHRRTRIPEPLQVPLLTLLLVLLHQLGQLNESSLLQIKSVLAAMQQAIPLLMIALPLSAAMALLTKLAEELGIRRPVRQGI